MKFEKFIATFFMVNIIALIALVYSAKNELVLDTSALVIYGQNQSGAYFELSPEALSEKGFKTDSPETVQKNFEKIFQSTFIDKEKLDEIKNLTPYERAVSIVQLFSKMGDGKCLTGLPLTEKINMTADKKGCSEDFADIFTVLAAYTGLPARVVSNGQHFGAEIYDGAKWIYIDPYFAMSASDEKKRMSFPEFAETLLKNGWIRFDFFGGEEHCMSGKSIPGHPYFGDTSQFAEIYTENGNNIFEQTSTALSLKDKPLFVRILYPYQLSEPEPIIYSIADSHGTIIRKYISGAIAVVALLLVFANIALPLYFLTGLMTRLLSKGKN